MTPPAPKPSVRVIEELRSLYAKATQGEWAHVRRTQKRVGHIRVPGGPFVFERGFGPRIAADADLIVVMHRHLPALLAVVEAATCIRHWHDSGPNNEGMVVSSEHVRKLWEALSALDATGGGHG